MSKSRFSCKEMTVTPKMAKQWLDEACAENRNIDSSHVDRLVGDMVIGNWEMNGEAIKFGINGKVTDGRHRLCAVVKSRVSIQTLVVFGVPSEAMKTLDSGKRRSVANNLQILGEVNFGPLSSALSFLCIYESGNLGSLGGHGRGRPTTSTALSTLKKNPGVRDSVNFVCNKHRPLRKFVGLGTVGALHYLGSQHDKKMADRFIGLLSSGQIMSDKNPVYLLREKLIANLGNFRKLHRGVKLAVLIKAWNFHVNNQEIKRLSFKDKDEFPEIEMPTELV